MSTEIVSKLANFVFLSLWEVQAKAVKRITQSLKNQIFIASKTYHDNFVQRHGYIKGLGMWKPISLEAIYIPTKFVDHEIPSSLANTITISDLYRYQNNSSHALVHEDKDGVDLANEFQYLTVIGEPGSGKSTFLKKIGIEALKSQSETAYKGDCIPVFIELRIKRIKNISLKELIIQEFKVCGFPEYEEFTEAALKQGKLLILLDGLDEVPDKLLESITLEIQNFSDLYHKNRFIISTRPFAYKHNLRRFVDVKISKFTPFQAKNFIFSWFKDNSDVANSCFNTLLGNDNYSIKEIIQTPLFLSLVCLLYQKSGRLPLNRATLYEKALRVLLEEWQTEKGIRYETSLYERIDTKRKELILAAIAFYMFKLDKYFLPRSKMVRLIEQAANRIVTSEKTIDGNVVLTEIEIQHGLLVERSEGMFSFSHLAIKEFLAAQFIIDNNKRVRNTIINHATDERWHEIFVLMAGLRQADELIETLTDQVQNAIQSQKLIDFLSWIDERGKRSTSYEKDSVKRSKVLLYLLEFMSIFAAKIVSVDSLSLETDRIRDLLTLIDENIEVKHPLDPKLISSLKLELAVDVAIGIALDFKEISALNEEKYNSFVEKMSSIKAKIDSSKHSESLKIACFSYIFYFLLSAIEISEDMLCFSQEELEMLELHINGCELIAKCLKSAIYVSPHVWYRAEAAILSPNSAVKVG